MNGGARSSLVCRGLAGLLRHVVISLISSASAVIMARVDDARKACVVRFLEEGAGCWQTRKDVVGRATSEAARRSRDYVPPMAAFLSSRAPSTSNSRILRRRATGRDYLESAECARNHTSVSIFASWVSGIMSLNMQAVSALTHVRQPHCLGDPFSLTQILRVGDILRCEPLFLLVSLFSRWVGRVLGILL